MKMIVILMLIPHLCLSQSFFENVNQFLVNHVNEGRIDYQYLKEHPKELDHLTTSIAEFYLSNQKEDFHTAFYINTYNILVIKQVVDNFPITSPKDVDGFFDETTFRVAGENLTLDQIEFQKLRPYDPRIHFALGCAAASCPFLYDQAYTPDHLQEQLEFRAQLIIDRPNYVEVNKGKRTVKLNKIFDWYTDQFLNVETSLLKYINKYRFYEVPEAYQIQFMQYDWTLNDIKR